MKVVNYNPFNNWVGDFFNNDFGVFPSREIMKNSPKVNIKEDQKAFYIELAAPGLEKEDFNVEIENDQLKISVQKGSKMEENKEGYSRKEFSYHSFTKSFTLPSTVAGDKIAANYVNGVLNIELPKVEELVKEPKKIEIA